jgi:hypothetical protein
MAFILEEPKIRSCRWLHRQSSQLMHLELHVYTGLFGSHVAFVMRRLRRLCAAVGNRRHLQFISCTATLPNAKQVFVVPYMSNESSTWRQYLDWTV